MNKFNKFGKAAACYNSCRNRMTVKQCLLDLGAKKTNLGEGSCPAGLHVPARLQ